MKTLLLIDIQNDFVPGGALAVGCGDEVIAVANGLMPQYDLVVATQDWHPADHSSFASHHPGQTIGSVINLDGVQQIMWPDHCVQHTHGAELCAGLHTDGIHEIVRKGTDKCIDSYSGFFDNGHRKETELAKLLRGRGVTAVDIMGLALDYCVKFTAMDARELGFETTLIRNGCRGVELNPGDCDSAVKDMTAAGVIVI